MATLRNIRRRQLLSQRDLAQRAGVTASTIYLIETRRTEPRLSVMRRICLTLGVQPLDVDEFRQALEIGEQATSARRAA